VLAYGAAVRVLRVSVNVGNSLGGSGLETNLAPSMTIGTGYFGRSSVGENLEPKHLVNWTRLAYNADVKEVMPDFAGLGVWRAPSGPVPAYPVPSNAGDAPVARVAAAPDGAGVRASDGGGDRDGVRASELREEIRRLIVEELREIVRG
jgi:acetaldehyde dehydrogenase/alcohol dehydrogenase